MGKVIALPPSRKNTTVQPATRSAEILFFTGVRYYRLSDEDFAKIAAPSPQGRAKAKTAIKTAAPVRKLRQRA